MVQKIFLLKLMNVANDERRESRLRSLHPYLSKKKSEIHKRRNSILYYIERIEPHTCM